MSIRPAGTVSASILVALLFLYPLVSEAIGEPVAIREVDEPHVIEIAEFAVSEFNKLSESHMRKTLVLKSVVEGTVLMVGGSAYRLVIAVKEQESSLAKNSTTTIVPILRYECSVWMRPPWDVRRGTSPMKLVEFDGIHFDRIRH